MSREEDLDYFIEQCLRDASWQPEMSADEAARVEAGMTLARLNAVTPPPAFAERLEARIRMQARAHQNGRVVHLERRSPPARVRRHLSPLTRAWIGALATAAVMILALVGVTNAAARSLPGDPLYGLKRWEQQMALSNAGAPTDRANVQITQLQGAISDLEAAVNDRRSDGDITQALNIVAEATHDSQAAVNALPAGTGRDAAEQALAQTLHDEQATLYRLLGHVHWSLRVSFSTQLGALGAAVPTVTSVSLTSGSNNTLIVKLTGTNFAQGAQLVINGQVRGTVTQNTGTTLTAIINASDWHEDEGRIGVSNPDGTAAQKVFGDDDRHDGSGDDDSGEHGTPIPGVTPTPGNDDDGHNGGGGDH